MAPCIEVPKDTTLVHQIGRRAASFTTARSQGRVQTLKKEREERLEALNARRRRRLVENPVWAKEVADEVVDQLEFVHSLLYDLARTENAELTVREDKIKGLQRQEEVRQAVAKRKMDTAKFLRCNI